MAALLSQDLVLHACSTPPSARARPGPLSEPSQAAGSGLHADPQPCAHGLDAHRSGRRPRPQQTGGLLSRARRRAGGPDRHRRLCAQHRRMGQALCRATDHLGRGAAPSRRHRCGAPGRRQDRIADPAHRALWLPPSGGGTVSHPVSHLPVHPVCALPPGRGAADPRLRQLCGEGARGGLRRGRDHGLRGLFHQPVSGAAHQPAHR